jgi:hypothetical protein
VTPRAVVLDAAPTEMKPEGVGSAKVMPSRLVMDWTSKLCVGISRIRQSSDQEHRRYYSFLIWKSPTWQSRPPKRHRTRQKMPAGAPRHTASLRSHAWRRAQHPSHISFLNGRFRVCKQSTDSIRPAFHFFTQPSHSFAENRAPPLHLPRPNKSSNRENFLGKRSPELSDRLYSSRKATILSRQIIQASRRLRFPDAKMGE